MREQSQHIDELLVAAAEPGADHLAMLAMAADDLDRLGERDGPMLADRGALLGLAQAGTVMGGLMQRRLGRPGGTAERGEERDDEDQSGNRHGAGFTGAPVNAG